METNVDRKIWRTILGGRKMTIAICKKCGRAYDSESFNNRVWHKEPWGCEEHEPK